MTPTAGDIFVTYNARLDAYVAIQITAVSDDRRSPQAAVLTLDWTGAAPPTEAEVAAMQPARFDFSFWDDRVDRVWVPLPVPPGYTRVGNRPPLVTGQLDSYGGGWADGSLHYAQRRWDAKPQALRDRFKAAAKSRHEKGAVSLEAVQATRVGNDDLAAIPDLPAFEGMPLLTSIYADRPIPGLFEFLRRRVFIYEAALRRHGETHVDLRGTHLTRLGIDVTGVRELHLNDGLEELTLHGTPDADLRIHAEDDGRWITHYAGDAAFAWRGLDALDTLWIRNVKEVDATVIVRRFPALTGLRIWGAPGYLRNVDALSTLPDLRTLTLNDMFGFDADAFPMPTSFPNMRMLWLSSVPADAAAAVKKAWKPATAGGVNLNVRQPRKPEWLAANLDNPFRNWEDAAGITPAQAKKAAALYRTARADALAVADAADPVAALSPIVLAYTQAFNKLDARSSFIQTEEREQIFMALMDIVKAVNERRATTGAAPVSRDAITDVMDSVRDF
jgi:hypothetical protein